ncbi:MAG: agmatine/peptidylarginine deiminase [Nitrospinales bacterium]
MPAEWEPHESTWLSWPHNLETWPQEKLNAVEAVYLSMIRALVKGETVNLLVNDAQAELYVTGKLKKEGIPMSEVHLHVIPTDDAWIRDYGPNFLVRGSSEKAINKWEFNSWGKKYEWEADNQAGNIIAKNLGLTTFRPGIVLEGGAIEVNGRGTCITTKQTLLNKKRNADINIEKMESFLRDYLGVTKIIWCEGDLEGDDTDGHIDNLVRFVNPTTVLSTWEDSASDPNYACLQNNYNILRSATDQDGQKLNVVRMPTPGYIIDGETRLPASYANFYISNAVVLLPVYDHPNDQIAANILKEYFPQREIVKIPCRDLVWGLGGIHCVTQQEPAV